VLGQSWRMMLAGVISYGVSSTLNIWIFDRLRGASGNAPFRGFVASALSQVVDTLIFISVSFLGVRPIWQLMAGQMLSKVVLSAVLVPVIVLILVRVGRRLDAGAPQS
jgi:queuosine precursor transporter